MLKCDGDIEKRKSALNVLIIGSADSLWIKMLIEYTHVPYGDNVTILSLSDAGAFENYYKNNGIKIIPIKCLRKLKGWMNVFNILYDARLVVRRFDLIVVHYVEAYGAILASLGSVFSKKLNLAFWGSDILRAKKNRVVEFAIKRATNLVISTKVMREKFHQIYGNGYDEKIIPLNYGSKSIECLAHGEYDRNKLNKKYGIDDNKIVVSLGSNRTCEQQHLKLLEVIEKLPNAIKDNIYIIIRLTDGYKDDGYISEIKRHVNNIGCKSRVFESYLSDEGCSEITMLTDVFVQALKTDARSAAMCEHLFAGALVIVPSWLRYDIEDKVFYLKYNNFDELGDVLKENIVEKGNSKYQERLLANKKAIYEIMSWDIHAPKWRESYYL